MMIDGYSIIFVSALIRVIVLLQRCVTVQLLMDNDL